MRKLTTLSAVVILLLLGCSDESSSPSVSSVSDPVCPVEIIQNELFQENFPASDISWISSESDVKAIEDAFNYARERDSTITIKFLMPSQAVWDTWGVQEQGLYLLNRERYDRGIKPFEGITNSVVNVAGTYAQLLYDTGTFSHTEDGTPWERLDRVSEIANNRDFFGYAENLSAHGSSVDYIANPVARAIFGWIYADSGSNWGHRKFCLATGLDDNSGDVGSEGLVGFGVVKGEAYRYGNFGGLKSTIVVMNAFDPSEMWDHASTIKVPLCFDAAVTP